jgi:hypothetical protein
MFPAAKERKWRLGARLVHHDGAGQTFLDFILTGTNVIDYGLKWPFHKVNS